MCGIVDANVAGKVFGDPKNPFETAKKFRERVEKEKMNLVFGGRIEGEVNKVNKAKRWFQENKRTGIVRQQDPEKVSAETKRLAESGLCKSDDPHVLALANVSGARLLYTNDKDLTTDFKNLQIIRPKGRVYRDTPNGKFSPAYEDLLRESVCNR